MYDKLVKRFNAIQTNQLKNPAYNIKINEVKGEISSIAGLATTDARNVIKNEMPNVSDLVKKKIGDIEGKRFMPDYNKFSNDILHPQTKK